MPKELSSRKKSFVPDKLIFVFIIGLVLGAVIQLMFIQPMLDNSDSFKSKLADCETSRAISDEEISSCYECLTENNLNPNGCQ